MPNIRPASLPLYDTNSLRGLLWQERSRNLCSVQSGLYGNSPSLIHLRRAANCTGLFIRNREAVALPAGVALFISPVTESI